MPLNYNLFKPEDDVELANAAPTIGQLSLARFSTPEKHNQLVYSADGLFFATHTHRRIYIRQALRNELDIYTDEADYQEQPMLWVAVTQLAEGHHMILPVWRGRQFWTATETDQAAIDVLMHACERGGLSLSDWYGFIAHRRVARKDAATSSKYSRKRMVQ